MERARTTAAQRIGDAGEDLAATRLEAAGWLILARNVRLGRDELDLVAVDPGPPAALVIVEVRCRGRRDFGLAEESLDHRKRAALRRGVGELLSSRVLPDGRPLPALPMRIDLVAIDSGGDGRPSLRHHRGIRP
jgi:putative endonuclease